MEKLEITVSSEGRVLALVEAPLPLELGRQSVEDSGLYLLQNLGSYFRVAIAQIRQIAIPREYLKMEWTSQGRVLVKNIHRQANFRIDMLGRVVQPGETVETDRESKLTLADGIVIAFRPIVTPENSASPDGGAGFRTLNLSLDSTSDNLRTEAKLGELISTSSDGQNGKLAVQLVRQSLDVLKKAAGSDEYFDAAVRAVANMIELDRAFVILRSQGNWKTRSAFSRESDTAETFTESSAAVTLPSGSGMLLQRILDMKQTLIYEPDNYMISADSSLMTLDRAVAAPMLNEAGEVIGAIYGDRGFSNNHKNVPIGELEATLLEVMASAVASGLARQKEEVIRASLSQFFSPAVTQRLEQDDDLLSGRDAEVTVLFCDIRGFSGITERVGPKGTIEWINDVLTELSECVSDTDGVLVDYIGDELMAMWGAPAEMPDHASRACRSAVEMLKLIEPLRERWKDITPDKFGFGIGINTGIARVGNTGSKVKFKYGPLGNTVNLASRVEGITKKLGVAALISESTVRAIGKEFDHRRIANVNVVGIQEPVMIHELKGDADDQWRSMSERYESALMAFDKGDLTAAARSLASLVHAHPDDNPSLVLLGRVVNALTHREDHLDSIWRMSSK